MKTATRIIFATWLIVSGSAGSPTPCVADTPVRLNQDVQISRYAVRLSDLFTGVPVEIDRDIAQAPPACKPAVYDEVVLNKLADTYRLDWQGKTDSNHIVVTSACARITNDMIHDAVLAKMKADVNGRKLKFEIAFDTRNLEINLFAEPNTPFKLENFSYDPTNKQFRADLTAPTLRGPFAQPITGRITVKRNVPILAHRLESGTTISTADLDWIEVPEERITADVITEPSQLIGREVRRDTPEGDILRSRDVMPSRLVLRGSLVTMKIETPFITVTSQGKAQQDGTEGETIRVMNTQSNRIVEGVVTAPGVIEIRTARKIALAE